MVDKIDVRKVDTETTLLLLRSFKKNPLTEVLICMTEMRARSLGMTESEIKNPIQARREGQGLEKDRQ